MAVKITSELMISDKTGHSATRAPGTSGVWHVSWLPGGESTRNQAITALTLAEIVATHDLLSDSPWWPHIDAWAAELGLTGPDAVVRAATGCLPAHPAPGGAR